MQDGVNPPESTPTGDDLHKLRVLLAAVALGDASQEDWRVLNELLLADAGARRYASQYLEEEGVLHREFAIFDRVATYCTPDSPTEAAEFPPAETSLRRRPPLGRRLLAWAPLATAAMILAVATASFVGDVDHDGVALPGKLPGRVVVGAYASAFEDAENRPMHVGDRIATDEGLASLRFDCGAQVVLKGPAELKIVSPMRATLLRGTLTAHIDEPAHGFRIDTPNSRVIDLGTEFGLSVDEAGATDMVVFTGKVALQYVTATPDDINSPAPYVPQSNSEMLGDGRLLTDGEAMSISQSGEVSRLMMVRDTDFPRARLVGGRINTDPPARAHRVIEQVSDNIRDHGTTKCYRVSEGGFTEDARAYVDRHYEWNGVHKRFGLPHFLRGADYVLPYCDDKVDDSLEVTVRIGQSARLYILLDNRLEIPSWLHESFRDTGYDVALDEDAYSNKRSWQRLGVGPGAYLDRTCSVWSRDVLEPGEIVLGGITPPSDWSVMYGIAARPLEEARAAPVEPLSHHQPSIGSGLVHAGVLSRPVAETTWERVDSFDETSLDTPATDDIASFSSGRRFVARTRGDEWLPHRDVTVLEGGALPALNDGLLSRNDDDLERNAWFNHQGRFTVDLLEPTLVDRINCYSWHKWGRAQQYFTVWGSNAEALPAFDFESSQDAVGWDFIGLVDTRFGDPGAVHVSQLASTAGSIGPYRHLLWIVERSEQSTFFTEVDVHAADSEADQ